MKHHNLLAVIIICKYHGSKYNEHDASPELHYTLIMTQGVQTLVYQIMILTAYSKTSSTFCKIYTK